MKKVLSKYREMPVQVKAALWYFICSFVQKGISVIVTPIFTRLMTTEEYGNYNVFNAWYGIITVFVAFELSKSVYEQGLVKFDKDSKKYSSSLQGLTFSLVVAWIIIYSFTKGFWNNLFGLKTSQMYFLLVLIWTSSAYRFWAAEKRVLLNYKSFCIVTLIVAITKPVLSVTLVVFSNDKVTARILGILIIEVIFYSFLFFQQVKNGKTFYSKRYWNYALSLGIPLIPHYLAQTVLESADRIMIRDYVGANEAGLYSLASSISSLMLIFNTSLLQTLSPWIYKKIKTNDFASIPYIQYPLLIFVACVNLLLVMVAPEMVAIFAPREYKEAIWVIPPIAISSYFIFLFELFARFEFYFEKKYFITAATAISALLNILLNHIFINKYGYFAAGYTTLVCYILYAVGHYIFMKRILSNLGQGEIYNEKVLLVISAATIVIGLSTTLLYQNVIIRLLIVLTLVVIVIIKRRTFYMLYKRIRTK